jgi:hypothetical protein
MKDQAPSDRIWLDTGVADKAGKARNDQTGRSAFRVMRQPPPKGLGLPLRSTTDPIKVDILNGVQRLKRAFNSRRYLITKEVWERGERATGNSIRKALLSYTWDNDALRYDCIIFNWNDTAIDQGYKPRGGGIKTREKRRVKVGGSKVRSF